MRKREKVKTILVTASVSMLIYGGFGALFGERAVPTVLAQQDPYLSRRIDQIEQRFNSIESRLNRVEQQSRTASVVPRITDNNDTEMQFFRTQVDSLRLRVGELECGLLRIDERTLTNAARLARSKGGVRESDKCRVSAGAPIQLSARP